jgi:photosystem II stability/assembly factor-like uncharacterized protein
MRGERQKAKVRKVRTRRGVSLALHFLLSSFALCLLHSAHAYSPWYRQQSGTFAWLHSVFFVDESRGWAVGGKGALLATADGGERWEARRRPSEDAMRDVFFTDARTGWILCERSIFLPMRKDESVSYLLKTTDGGESWSRVDVTRGEDVDVKLAGLRFADASHGWVYGEGGVLYATQDGGATWSRQRVPTRHLLLGSSFIDARTGWLSGGGLTILSTTDGGTTWRAGTVYAAADSSPVQAGPRVQQKGTEPARPDVPFRPQRLNAVSFVDAETGWAVGAGGAIYATTDGGRTWRPRRSGVGSDLTDVKFLDRSEGWAVGGDGTVLHTTDGGVVWTEERRRTTEHALERLFFIGRARGWAVGFGGTVIAFRN